MGARDKYHRHHSTPPHKEKRKPSVQSIIPPVIPPSLNAFTIPQPRFTSTTPNKVSLYQTQQSKTSPLLVSRPLTTSTSITVNAYGPFPTTEAKRKKST
ncbi:hypothetical protein K458DRAFT_115465 [Lentithecium fluviatile CBS 122367]|uniref:Uncharacterized protein n=1 Tax=Lentithecium fluviatile CBS 122367 TaxID=1168545 RepID=A0A6G1IN10_9PLEO|nr:hypothetical protein K458DRAFT_115465 [Lentithecium fluviatile CBS 122367]